MSEVKNEGLEVVAVYDGKYLLQLMYMDTDEELCRHSEAIAGYAVLRARIAELEAESAEWSPVMQRLGDENQQLRAELAAAKETITRYETTAENCDLLRAELAAIKGQEPVAWRTPSGGLFDRKEVAETGFHGHICKVTPLYAAPAPSAVVMPDDAARGAWLIEYMASEREDLDDTLMTGCSENQPDVLRLIIDKQILAASPAAKGAKS